MRNTIGTFAFTSLLALGMAGSAALAQDAPQEAGGPPQQQGQGPHRMNPDMQLKHLTKQLDLTADQQAQIKPILVARDQQAEQLFADQSLSHEDRHSRLKTIQDDSKAKIEAVLNDSQKQKYEQMTSEMRDHRHGGGEAAPPPQQ